MGDAVPTIKVYVREFGGELITINEADFDPDVHRKEADGPWTEMVFVKGSDTPIEINVEDFDAALHRHVADGSWPEEPKGKGK